MEVVTYSLETQELEQWKGESMPAGTGRRKDIPCRNLCIHAPHPSPQFEDAKAQGSLTKEPDPASEEQFACGSLVKSGIKG